MVLVALVCLAVVAVRQAVGGDLRPGGSVGPPRENRALAGEQARDDSSPWKKSLLDFFHHSPKAFRESFILYMVGQVTAVLEVYLILRLMGYHAGFTSALAIEGLTKLVNVIGMINPGNAGTYEGGNMLLARLASAGANRGIDFGADP